MRQCFVSKIIRLEITIPSAYTIKGIYERGYSNYYYAKFISIDLKTRNNLKGKFLFCHR